MKKELSTFNAQLSTLKWGERAVTVEGKGSFDLNVERS